MAEKKKRNYRQEYDSYHGKPEQRKKRSKRVMARRKMVKAGKASKGDGKDVDHKRTLRNGGSNSKSNLRMRSKASNRSAGGKSGNKAGKARGGRNSHR